jgi:carbamoyl-phosphate synthase small subunit
VSTRRAYLALADGTVFPGNAFGGGTPAVGEVVFTTGMTGYQEVLTDPSYTGQIVTMTAPQIGNTGINGQDPESVNGKVQVAGLVIREESPVVSNYRSQETLDAYLSRSGIIGISEIDTRKLTRHLRDNGSQNGAIGTEAPDTLVDRARSAPNMEGMDLVGLVSPKAAYEFTESRAEWRG